MSRSLAALAAALIVTSGCTEIPPPEQPYAAMPAVRRLRIGIAQPIVQAADHGCRSEIIAPLVLGDLGRALASSGYRVVTNGPADVVLTLTVEPTECGTLDAAVDPQTSVRLTASAGTAMLFDQREPYFETKSASVQAVTYADWAPRIVNDLSRSPALGQYAAAVFAPPPLAATATPVSSVVPTLPTAPTAPTGAPVAPPAPVWKTGGPHPEAHVLAIGLESYAALPHAVGARADAERFADLGRITLGASPDHVTRLLDQEATKSAVEDAIRNLAKGAKRGDRIYVSFAGDGSADADGAPVLDVAPDPAQPNALAKLPLASVIEDLRAARGTTVIVFLDVSFAGKGARAAPADKPSPAGPLIAGLPAGFMVITGSKRNEPAGTSVATNGGLFSSIIDDALGAGAADIDGDGNVSLAELLTWSTPRVARMSKDLGAAQTLSVFEAPGIGDKATFFLATGLAK